MVAGTAKSVKLTRAQAVVELEQSTMDDKDYSVLVHCLIFLKISDSFFDELPANTTAPADNTLFGSSSFL